jgi:hypothetical protein
MSVGIWSVGEGENLPGWLTINVCSTGIDLQASLIDNGVGVCCIQCNLNALDQEHYEGESIVKQFVVTGWKISEST